MGVGQEIECCELCDGMFYTASTAGCEESWQRAALPEHGLCDIVAVKGHVTV